MSNRNSTYESVLTNCCFTKFNESFLLFKITYFKSPYRRSSDRQSLALKSESNEIVDLQFFS